MINDRSARVIAAAVAVSLAVLGAGCAAVVEATGGKTQKAAVGEWGFDTAGMDMSVKPGDDFFRYANGTWLKTVQIPADRSGWGTWYELDEAAERDVRAIIDEVSAKQNPAGSIEQKIGDTFAAYMDVDAIEKAGLDPARPALADIAAAKTHEDIARLMGRPDLPVGGPMAFSWGLDRKNPARYSMDINQGGLGLPNRDYYLKDDDKFREARAKYRAYLETVLTLADYPDAAKAADAIMALETKFAEVQWPIEKQRNRDLTYNPKTRAELKSFAPQFPWQAFLESSGLSEHDFYIVYETDAVQKLARLFSKTPVSTWRAYLTERYLHSNADILPKAFDEARFDMFGRTLAGSQQQRERWKRAVGATSGTLGEAIGQIYVQRHFPPEAKAQMLTLVNNLKEAYRRSIKDLDWMGPETKSAALRKLDTMVVKIGYPDKWRDYATLEVKAGDPIGNRSRAIAWQWAYDVARLAKPTDPSEWFINPQEVNAYYNPQFNEIVFPAAILQPPFFDPNADPAVNYGGIGGVIGHEIGHGFDDQGSKSDERGVERDWWTKEDRGRFVKRTVALAKQYDAFSPVEGLNVKGMQTLGENIGDLGGLGIAYEAYKLSLNGNDAPVIGGFTGDQRFFLGWAQIWRVKQRDELLRLLVTSDVHSPAEFRVVGPTRNVGEWYGAFAVDESGKNYLPPGERVQIW